MVHKHFCNDAAIKEGTRGCRDGSAVMTACFFSRGPECSFQHLYWEAHNFWELLSQ